MCRTSSLVGTMLLFLPKEDKSLVGPVNEGYISQEAREKACWRENNA